MSSSRDLISSLELAVASGDLGQAESILKSIIDMHGTILEIDEIIQIIRQSPQELQLKNNQRLSDPLTVFDLLFQVTNNFEQAFKLAIECSSLYEALKNLISQKDRNQDSD